MRRYARIEEFDLQYGMSLYTVVTPKNFSTLCMMAGANSSVPKNAVTPAWCCAKKIVYGTRPAKSPSPRMRKLVDWKIVVREDRLTRAHEGMMMTRMKMRAVMAISAQKADTMPPVTRTSVAVVDSVRSTLDGFYGTYVPWVFTNTIAPCGNLLFSCFNLLPDLQRRVFSRYAKQQD